MPANDGDYLVCVAGYGHAHQRAVYIGELLRFGDYCRWSSGNDNLEQDGAGWGYKVTHWAPLPDLPEDAAS